MWTPVRSVKWGKVWTALLRVAGLFLIVQQGLSSQPTEKPVLYLAALAMMGVSITVPADKKRHDRDEDE